MDDSSINRAMNVSTENGFGGITYTIRSQWVDICLKRGYSLIGLSYILPVNTLPLCCIVMESFPIGDTDHEDHNVAECKVLTGKILFPNFNSCARVFSIHVCMCTTCVPVSLRDQQRASDPPGLELQIVKRGWVGAGKESKSQ